MGALYYFVMVFYIEIVLKYSIKDADNVHVLIAFFHSKISLHFSVILINIYLYQFKVSFSSLFFGHTTVYFTML